MYFSPQHNMQQPLLSRTNSNTIEPPRMPTYTGIAQVGKTAPAFSSKAVIDGRIKGSFSTPNTQQTQPPNTPH